MTVAHKELVNHLTEQKRNAMNRIKDRLAALSGTADLQEDSLRHMDELSQLVASFRVYRDLLSRLNDTHDVTKAYCGLMAARLATVEEHEIYYLRELGEEAYFAGVGPGIRMGK